MGVFSSTAALSGGFVQSEQKVLKSVLVRIILDSVFASEPVVVGHYSIRNDILVLNALCE
jgi:hypothetical protein